MREVKPSFVRMFSTCVSAVRCEMTSREAISRLLSPSATSAAISLWRRVSCELTWGCVVRGVVSDEEPTAYANPSLQPEGCLEELEPGWTACQVSRFRLIRIIGGCVPVGRNCGSASGVCRPRCLRGRAHRRASPAGLSSHSRARCVAPARMENRSPRVDLVHRRERRRYRSLRSSLLSRAPVASVRSVAGVDSSVMKETDSQ